MHAAPGEDATESVGSTPRLALATRGEVARVKGRANGTTTGSGKRDHPP